MTHSDPSLPRGNNWHVKPMAGLDGKTYYTMRLYDGFGSCMEFGFEPSVEHCMTWAYERDVVLETWATANGWENK